MSLADALYRIGDGSGREGQEHLICITGLGPLYDAFEERQREREETAWQDVNDILQSICKYGRHSFIFFRTEI